MMARMTAPRKTTTRMPARVPPSAWSSDDEDETEVPARPPLPPAPPPPPMAPALAVGTSHSAPAKPGRQMQPRVGWQTKLLFLHWQAL